MTPEFSRRIAIDTIGHEPRTATVEADANERAALAVRLGLEAIDGLSATVTLVARAAGIDANGRLVASVVQTCVVTGDPVPAQIDEDFALRFVDPDLIDSGTDERELGPDECDIVAIEGEAIDLGEAVAQTLGLALDPFPRSPDAPAGDNMWKSGPEGGAFAGLKGLLKS